jgi:protoheme IX farnesyltransferase
MIPFLRILSELSKARISLFAAFTTAAGFILARHEVSGEMVQTLAGIFLLACGSCSLNQYQDRIFDALMERTKGRPLPSGRMGNAGALVYSLILLFAGSILLLCGRSRTAVLLGLLAVVWYNGVYRYLKRRTALAAIPGAVIGMIPPAVGWVSGGGHLIDPELWAVAVFFFLWQVPHFWLLFLAHADDYEKAGFPSLRKIFSADQIRGIILIWLLAVAAYSLCIQLFVSIHFLFVHLLLIAMTLWLVWSGLKFYRSHVDRVPIRAAFIRLTVFPFIIFLILSLDALLFVNPASMDRVRHELRIGDVIADHFLTDFGLTE